MSKEKMGMRIGESIFSIGYLLFTLVASIIFLNNYTNKIFLLYGIMTLILGIGDSFHLIPRIIKNIKGNNDKTTWWMNFGLIVTSITMTIFYIFLFYIWQIKYNDSITSIVKYAIWITAIARILICLLPQNNWFNGGNKKMSILRNGIFIITGLIDVVLFIMLKNSYGITNSICIILSFLFYIPVTLYGKEKPKLGMLMIPKTIMYIIIISLGLSLL